jgi:dTDP-4-dehydrorhamnose reductase
LFTNEKGLNFGKIMNQRKRVLITGSNGLLGQKLSDLYLKETDVDWLATGKGENRHPQKDQMQYAHLDVCDFMAVDACLQTFKPDVVIHTAAMTQVDDCEFQKEACELLNIETVDFLAKKSVDYAYRLVHLSTDFIFDGTKKMYTEEDEPNPLSYYGWSKWEAEQRVMKSAKDYAILRTVLVYGKVADMSRSNIMLWAYNVLKEGKVAKVVNDQFRTPTLAEDLAQGCFLAAHNTEVGIYNIAGPEFISIYDLVAKIAGMYGFSMSAIETVSSETLNQPAKRPPITGLDIQKARKEWNFEPHSLEEGIRICLGF